jgi:hypothetical protein
MIGQDGAELGDLGHNAALRPAILGTVMRGRDPNIDKVPARTSRDFAAILIGPRGRIRQRFSRLQ